MDEVVMDSCSTLPSKLCVMLLTLFVMEEVVVESSWLLLLHLLLLLAVITRLWDITPFLFMLNKEKENGQSVYICTQIFSYTMSII
jgi:hypothetical protein